MAEMISLYKSGNAEAAQKIHLDLMPVFDVMGITTNPIPVKAAVNLLGFDAGDPRLPLVPATDEEKAAIRDVLSRAGVI
jgi:4-hydroxy-tetrahydrodipicolinate synthase